MQALAKRVIPDEQEAVVTADPDDDVVLACARTAGVQLIISGDRHLLALKAYRGIEILSPAAAPSGWGLGRAPLPISDRQRLTQEHRLVYPVADDRVDFLQARYHY